MCTCQADRSINCSFLKTRYKFICDILVRLLDKKTYSYTLSLICLWITIGETIWELNSALFSEQTYQFFKFAVQWGRVINYRATFKEHSGCMLKPFFFLSQNCHNTDCVQTRTSSKSNYCIKNWTVGNPISELAVICKKKTALFSSLNKAFFSTLTYK